MYCVYIYIYIHMASRRGRDKTNGVFTFPYILLRSALSAHVLPHIVVFCHMLPRVPKTQNMARAIDHHLGPNFGDQGYGV